MILPSNPGDVNSFVAQALSVYKHVANPNQASIQPAETVNAVLNTKNVDFNQLNEDKTSVKMNIE